MVRPTKGTPSPVPSGFDYTKLDVPIAEQLRATVARIRERTMISLEAVMEIGNELRAAKKNLRHGAFGRWLKAEFGWTERTARNFMAVAERFGPKTEMISDLAISPSAAYLLAAPSAPDEAREMAVARAQLGEQITPSVAKDILAEVRKKTTRRASRAPGTRLLPKLQRSLERYRQRWRPAELPEFVRQLREFADTLERSSPPDRPDRGKP